MESRFYLIIFFTAIFAYSLAAENAAMKEFREKIFAANSECEKKWNITEEQRNSLRKWIVPKDRNPQCFVACMAKTLKIMDNDNKIKIESVRDFLKPVESLPKFRNNRTEVMKNITEICLQKQTENKDECLAMKNLMQCYSDERKRYTA